MSDKKSINVVWFKRDFRVSDHAPLYQASLEDIPVLPLYIIEPDLWEQPDYAQRHWHFIYDCLVELNKKLEDLGQGLIIKHGNALDVFDDLSERYDIRNIFAHEETGNGWSYERDKEVSRFLQSQSISFKEYPTNGVVRGLKDRDEWAKQRNVRMAEALIPKLEKLHVIEEKSEQIPKKDDAFFGAPLEGQVQQGGRQAGLKILKSFLYDRAEQYVYSMSAPEPSEIYCSRLSPHLTWGTLSSREVVYQLKKRRNELTVNEKHWKRHLTAFQSRLSWRCHFVQKLEQQPSIEFECMHPGFEGMRESEFNEEYFKAWKEGCTGYPLIDACMKSLTHQGWITFRMRAMLVSFASYHLWLDWRRTAYHLATLFTDYEPGIHYSQMQMQSGVTGINTLRIYNPIKQSEDHDPEGRFIKKWLPELKDVPPLFIHTPWEMTILEQQDASCLLGKDYPLPIVDHKDAVAKARQKIAEVQKQDSFHEQAKEVYQKLGSRNRPLSRRVKKMRSKQIKEESNQLALFD
ncbi:MAG: deoxyribodipyrimidine photo-lyase [Pseudomonadota bacterium]